LQVKNKKTLVSGADGFVSSYLSAHIQWIILIGILLSIKGSIFYLDSLPMFFLGDSASYITTALHGWIPPDRSFLYGFVIRFITIFSHSLTSLIAFQVFLSALTSFFAAYALEHYFFVRRKLAFAIGVLCAIEPLQLLYERYVMTETMSLFVFVIYMLWIFQYLEKPKLSSMVILQIIGTALISLRLSFLPLILLNTFILPLLAVPFSKRIIHAQSNKWSAKFMTFLHKGRLTIVTLHLVISISSVFFIHSAYKQLNGFLIGYPPAYQYQSGIFLLGDWAPVIKPDDLPYPELAATVFGKLRYDITDRNTREAQRWMVGGLISNLNKTIPNALEADNIAKETAINALQRDPVGIAYLAAQGFSDYWDWGQLEKSMIKDQGGKRELPELLLQALQENFDLDAESFPTLKTLTNTYYFSAGPWYLFLLCTPALSLFSLFFCENKLRKNFFEILLATSISVIVASVLIERPTIRYLHPLGWLFFLILGAMMERLLVSMSCNKLVLHS